MDAYDEAGRLAGVFSRGCEHSRPTGTGARLRPEPGPCWHCAHLLVSRVLHRERERAFNLFVGAFALGAVGMLALVVLVVLVATGRLPSPLLP